MKHIFLFIATLIYISAHSQIKFSGFTPRTTLTGTEYIVGYNGPTNIRVPIGKIAANKIDSTSVSYGPSEDTTWYFKEGVKKYYKLSRAGTTGGTTSAPTAPTPAAGDNSTRIATTAAIIAERTASGTYTGKTFNGINNTFLNIPQSAVTNVAADIAARVTFTQLRDSLNRVDTTRKLVFVNLGTGYGLVESANADSVKVLSLVGDGTTATVTRVGNNLVVSATVGSLSGYPTLAGNNTWTGTNTFNGDVAFRPHTTSTGYIFYWTNSNGDILGGVLSNGQLSLGGLPDLADNAAALAAGLGINRIYRTGDVLKIVH